MRPFLSPWLFACLVLLVACQAGAPGSADGVATLDDVTNGFAEGSSRAGGEAAAPALTFLSKDGHGGKPAVERLLIYRGEVRVEVARPDDAAREWLARVKEWGGYLHSQVGNTLTVRVPAARLDDAFAAARGLGRVLAEGRQANDVTEEFVDLGLRIDTAKKARERLLEVLQKAEKIEDILKVEAELRRLTDEIERMEGRRKFLADQVAMATLQATFQPTTAPPPVKKSRQRSRFAWVNRVGAETIMGDF
jgi:hypothetical protein